MLEAPYESSSVSSWSRLLSKMPDDRSSRVNRVSLDRARARSSSRSSGVLWPYAGGGSHPMNATTSNASVNGRTRICNSRAKSEPIEQSNPYADCANPAHDDPKTPCRFERPLELFVTRAARLLPTRVCRQRIFRNHRELPGSAQSVGKCC